MARVGETREELSDRGACSRTGDGSTQESNRTAITADVREFGLDLAVDFGPRGFLSIFQGVLQALRIVEAENGGLSRCTQSAARNRMLGIPLQLDGPAVAHLGEESAASTAPSACGCIEERTSRHYFLGLRK